MGAYVYPVDNWQASDGSKYTGRRLRQLIGALVTGKTTRPLGARSGVMAGTPASTVTATSSVCTIQPHTGVVDAQTLAIAGPYFYAFDDVVTRTVAAPDSTSTRIDLVVVQVSDPTESDGTLAPGVDVVYVTGTPGAGQPATPARSLLLATVNVPKVGSGSPVVSFVARRTVATGGIIPCTTSADYPSTPYVGQVIDDATVGLLRWTGSAWRIVRGNTWQAHQAGTTNIPTNGSAWTTIPMTAVDVDPAGWGLTSGGLVVKQAGTYKIAGGAVGFASQASGSRGARVTVNGAGILGTQTLIPGAAAGSYVLPVGVGHVTCAVGDTLLLQALQNSGVTVATIAGVSTLVVERTD